MSVGYIYVYVSTKCDSDTLLRLSSDTDILLNLHNVYVDIPDSSC